MRTLTIHIATLICFFICGTASAQQQRLIFIYDSAGNVIERKIQVTAIEKNNHSETGRTELKAVTVFPNPASDAVFIDGPLPEWCTHARVTLLNISGQVLYECKYYGARKQFSVRGVPNGTYLIEIRTDRGMSTYKLIVNHP